MVGFCDLLGTPHAPVSEIPSVKAPEFFLDSKFDFNLRKKFVKQN